MASWRMVWLVAASGLSVTAFGQSGTDSAAMVTGPIYAVSTAAGRNAAVQLLARARNSYALRSARRGYDARVTFIVNSEGQTDYDGAWEMEDLFAPRQGLRWTATGPAGFKVARISSNGMSYGQGTSRTIPLRLQEARAALFDPIPSDANVKHQSMRTSTGTLNSVSLTCILLSRTGNTATAGTGRSWDETEECIDPQSGLLQTHSQVPGRYYRYEYTNAARLGNHVLPGKVTVTEAGKIVSTISVEGLTEVTPGDPGLFVPTVEMKAARDTVMLGSAQRILTNGQQETITSDATTHTVCVFGLVTASGQLIEAHSLQPADPNSHAALEEVKRMTFSAPTMPGASPQQHFVFVIERFIPSTPSFQ